MSAEHEVIRNWCNQLGDVNLALLHALALQVLHGHPFSLVFVKSQGTKREAQLRTIGHLSSTSLLSCQIRPLYETMEVKPPGADNSRQ